MCSSTFINFVKKDDRIDTQTFMERLNDKCVCDHVFPSREPPKDIHLYERLRARAIL